ncbi:MAG: peptidylprolyl isomerase [Deltaproteobacteria bacterium]|jgi:peptidylprolyl isomerase|nr:peptidylprolyl isomerase [Deltaproteobacteria bacterium]
MAEAKLGDTVKIHFTGKLPDETVIETSKDRDPLEFKIGEGDVISGLEQGVIGMAAGDKKTIAVSPEDGFGQPQEDLVVDLNKSEFPEDVELAVGAYLNIESSDGKGFQAQVVEIKEDMVTLDANHPLAGATINFDVELIEIL